ncbi:hypothetical protein Tco_1042367 [Tanacetum coccineum]|uniref:Retrovirus-related Pol polyprotein from transposon TNT 1-94 n=1 Tax=Tanacetum coccineum TaxID=301880 RepID=A0ABQ5GL13_9ASTR
MGTEERCGPAGCKDDCKSTSGGLQFLGGKLMSWSSKKQDCTVMSTAEVEYVSLSACCAQTKHIDIRYHFIKEHVEKGTVEIYFVGTEYQLADLFTKALPKECFEYLVHRIGMRCMTPTQLESLTNYGIKLKEDGSNSIGSGVCWTRKYLTLTLDDFRQIFHLPQATANNHNSFMPASSFFDMVPFYKQVLGFTMEVKTQSNFKTTSLLQPWQTHSSYWLPHERIGTTSAPRSPNPDKEAAESSAPKRSTMICLHIPERRSTRLTPPALVPIFNPRNDEPNIPGTRIEPKSNKERPEVEITKDKEVEITKETLVVEITNVVKPVNVNDDDEEITDEFMELKRREKGKLLLVCTSEGDGVFSCKKSLIPLDDNLHDVMVETLPTMVDKHIKEQVMKQVPEQVRNQVLVYVAEGLILERQKAKEKTKRLIAKAILQECGNIQAQISTQIENAIANVISSQVDASNKIQLYLAMKDDPQLQQQDIAIWLALQMKFGRATVPQIACRTPAVRPRNQDEPHDDTHPEGENSAKWQKTTKYEAYVSGESSSGQDLQEELAPSTLGNQEQDDDFDFWIDSYASDNDEIPSKQVTQDIMEEVLLTIDEAKLRKMADEM